MGAKLSAIIPTLNAESSIGALIDALAAQSLLPDEILVIDSSSDDRTCEVAAAHDGVRVHVIARSDFNHGSTRDVAFRMASGEYTAFFTQDAMPANAECLANLIAPLDDDSCVAVATGRQLPKTDARRFEQLVREFNYPGQSNIRSAEDILRCGIKAFFVSDVCAAYRRTAYLACGGFPRVETNEDMLMAAKLMDAGYKVAYAADARVYHSHNLALREQFERNRAIGRVLQARADLLGSASEMNEGVALVKGVARQLLSERRIGELFAFGVDCAARLIGNRIGRRDAKRMASSALDASSR